MAFLFGPSLSSAHSLCGPQSCSDDLCGQQRRHQASQQQQPLLALLFRVYHFARPCELFAYLVPSRISYSTSNCSCSSKCFSVQDNRLALYLLAPVEHKCFFCCVLTSASPFLPFFSALHLQTTTLRCQTNKPISKLDYSIPSSNKLYLDAIHLFYFLLHCTNY